MPADTLTPTHLDALSIRVRFSADQLRPIFMGLDDLVQENNHVRDTGSLRRHPNLPDEFDRYGQYEAPMDEQMSALLSAHNKIQPRLEMGGWIRLDHRELTACAVALSHAKRLVSKKHAETWNDDYKAVARRLHDFIEKYRKRAIKQLPASLQRPEREKIVADLRAVRQRLAPNVTDKKQPRCIRTLAREVVSKGEKCAIAGLKMRGFEPPSDTSPFRQKVRACLRNIGKRGFSRRAFLEEEISAALTLADYVIKHTSYLVRRIASNDDERPRVRPTDVAPSKNAPRSTRKTETSLAAVLRKEVPACLRIACSELEWLMAEDLDGKSAWSNMSRPDRVAAVAKAKRDGGKGLSNRHISQLIRVDDHTVARMLKEAALPKEVRTQIARGNKSGNQALREASDPLYQQKHRLNREMKDGGLSDALAEQILRSLSKSHPGYAPQIIARAKELTARVPLSELERHVPNHDVEDMVARSQSVRFTADRDDPGIDAAANQLRWWLLRVAPEQAIHNSALNKALETLPNHAVYGSKS